MGRLTLRLPDTFHQQLIHLAESEGVALNQKGFVLLMWLIADLNIQNNTNVNIRQFCPKSSSSNANIQSS
ncbi:hypothetical protein APA_3093 [Pseudanabaena sp. lw0831]|uniref:toxin-antitoxin system HicB family antitoxin n=1 Tax=Pseudanabaena sp. lw0831 TaxID=1357935 RepID=UPI001914FBCD|nr:toxin-antitoxin system HicB family antitoxin [Pseudanabaena sp. lw0831]GBO55043.1 hypothetical protein APA_3093 [Pseudanabaena sp. lw0831]